MIRQPVLTKFLGVWIADSEHQKTESRLAHEAKMIEQLEAQLPSFDLLDQNFNYRFQYWSPLYWKGYKQTTSYSFVLEDLSDLDNVFKAFRENIRRNIRKAEKECVVTEGEDLEAFYKIIEATFKHQNQKVPYSFDLVKQLYQSCKGKSSGKLYLAKDQKGEIMAGIYLVWDEQSVYYLMGGVDKVHKSSGVMSLLLWNGIQFAASKGLKFDFEGSVKIY